MDTGIFSLVNQSGGNDVPLDFFPREITTLRRANWEPVDTVGGTQSIYYSNTGPRQLRIEEVWLDGTFVYPNESIKPQIDELMALQDKTDKGMPPVLLAIWGDRWEHGVLEELQVTEVMHLLDGTPVRARVSLTLLEYHLQEEVDVIIHEDDVIGSE